jgi:hypothetical protein
MKRLKRLYSITAVAVFALAVTVLPANAVTAPGSATCTGVAEVSPGIFAPGFGPSQEFDWSLTTTCTTVSGDLVEQNVPLNASGTAVGFCGQSTGLSGSGSLGDVELSGITWTSGGTVLIVTGSHNGGGAGTFEATVEANGGEDCTGVGATKFEVVIESVFA